MAGPVPIRLAPVQPPPPRFVFPLQSVTTTPGDLGASQPTKPTNMPLAQPEVVRGSTPEAVDSLMTNASMAEEVVPEAAIQRIEPSVPFELPASPPSNPYLLTPQLLVPWFRSMGTNGTFIGGPASVFVPPLPPSSPPSSATYKIE